MLLKLELSTRVLFQMFLFVCSTLRVRLRHVLTRFSCKFWANSTYQWHVRFISEGTILIRSNAQNISTMGLSLGSRAAAIKSTPERRSLSDHANSLCEVFFSEARRAKSIETDGKSIFTITLMPRRGEAEHTTHLSLRLCVYIRLHSGGRCTDRL